MKQKGERQEADSKKKGGGIDKPLRLSWTGVWKVTCGEEVLIRGCDAYQLSVMHHDYNS